MVTQPCHIQGDASLRQPFAVGLDTISRCFPGVFVQQIAVAAQHDALHMGPVAIGTDRCEQIGGIVNDVQFCCPGAVHGITGLEGNTMDHHRLGAEHPFRCIGTAQHNVLVAGG